MGRRRPYQCNASPAVNLLQRQSRVETRFSNGEAGVRTPPGRMWRYYQVLPPAPSGALCVIFKNDMLETWVGGACSEDGGLTFSKPKLLLPTTWSLARMTHNLAVLPLSGGRFGVVGGQYRPRVSRGPGDAASTEDSGVFVSLSKRAPSARLGLWGVARSLLKRTGGTGPAWCFTRECLSPAGYLSAAATGAEVSERGAQWEAPVRILDGTHPGCVERHHGALSPDHVDDAWRTQTPGRGEHCEFDGRYSLVRHRGRYLLFARANSGHAVRHVQVTSSTCLECNASAWAPFELVRLPGVDPWASSGEKANVYFFGAQVRCSTVYQHLEESSPKVWARWTGEPVGQEGPSRSLPSRDARHVCPIAIPPASPG